MSKTAPKVIGKTAIQVLTCGLLLVASTAANRLIQHHAENIADSVEDSLERARERRQEKRDAA